MYNSNKNKDIYTLTQNREYIIKSECFTVHSISLRWYYPYQVQRVCSQPFNIY